MIEFMFWVWLSTGTLINGRCSICIGFHKTSKVYPGYCMTTAMACSGHFDEQGKWVDLPKCNHTSCSYTCSRGHNIATVD